VVCLTWNDVDDRFIHFSKRVVESINGKIVQEGLKSENNRKFPINSLVQGILSEQKSKGLEGDLVFPSPTKGMIHIQNFSQRAWKTILSELEFKYKRPYTSRASFITHTLEHLDAKDVGRICGNLPETIYQHYASSNVASLIVPNTF
jgi:integrase